MRHALERLRLRTAKLPIIEAGREFFLRIPFLPTFVTLAGFLILRFFLVRAAALPEQAYLARVIAAGTLEHLFRLSWVIVAFISGVALLVCASGRALEGWNQWRAGRALRALVIVAALTLAWPHATYDYNFYFDRWHAADRVALLVLFAAICWRPVFVLPFLLVLLPVAGQFQHPIGGFSWAVPDQSINLLILFSAFHLVSLGTGDKRPEAFLYLACCLVAIHYWPSGLDKVRMGWLQHDHIEFLLPNAHANGWLPSLSAEELARWTRALADLSPFLKAFTLFAECGTLLFLWRRRLSIALLSAWILFHAGIFAVTGICLWQWIVVDASLLVLVWRAQPFRAGAIYSKPGAILAFFLIGSSQWWLKPISLTWFDARATYTYRFYASGESGTVYHLPPNFFAPYDYQFTLGAFHYLAVDPTLGVTMGATAKPSAEALAEALTPEEVLAVERELGTEHFDPGRSDRLAAFLKEFVSSVNRAPARNEMLRMLHPPRMLWTFGEPSAYRREEPIRRIESLQILSTFDGKTSREIRRRRVLLIEIPITDEEARRLESQP